MALGERDCKRDDPNLGPRGREAPREGGRTRGSRTSPRRAACAPRGPWPRESRRPPREGPPRPRREWVRRGGPRRETGGRRAFRRPDSGCRWERRTGGSGPGARARTRPARCRRKRWALRRPGSASPGGRPRLREAGGGCTRSRRSPRRHPSRITSPKGRHRPRSPGPLPREDETGQHDERGHGESRADSKRGRPVGELEPVGARGNEHGREGEVRPPERDFRSVQARFPPAVVRAREDEVARFRGLRIHRQGLRRIPDDSRDREAPPRARRGEGPCGRREKDDRLRVEVRRGKRAKDRLIVRFTGRSREKDASQAPGKKRRRGRPRRAARAGRRGSSSETETRRAARPRERGWSPGFLPRGLRREGACAADFRSATVRPPRRGRAAGSCSPREPRAPARPTRRPTLRRFRGRAPREETRPRPRETPGPGRRPGPPRRKADARAAPARTRSPTREEEAAPRSRRAGRPRGEDRAARRRARTREAPRRLRPREAPSTRGDRSDGRRPLRRRGAPRLPRRRGQRA